MKVILFLILSTIINCTLLSNEKLEIKDNWYYINGDKFFIKGIGYEIGARPGQNPYEDKISDLARMQSDLKIIKDAGFNTIRTWSALSEDQLKIVQKSGLKIIFGITINPEGEFGNPNFVNQSLSNIENVVSYSRNYDCIISYLVMNEPMTDHIHKCGANAFLNILKEAKAILNQQHKGIPVSISGSLNADFINLNPFDFYAFNLYDNAAYQQGVMGYTGYIKWLSKINGNRRPIVITEFGYSVSPDGPGNLGYGGNTLEQQRVGILKNYRSILDAGAVGTCVFYYADGWWKGGQDSIHNSSPEEWFGLFGYSNIKDTLGTSRPAWNAVSNYLKALIISPKNQQIYNTKIPIELYLDNDVKEVVIKLNDSIIYSKAVSKKGYFADSINCNPKDIEDAEFVFEFFDKDKKEIKSEIITDLLTKKGIEIPELEMQINPESDLNDNKNVELKAILGNLGPFKIAGDLKYNVNFHIGWETGPQGVLKGVEKDGKLVFTQNETIPNNSWIAVASVGIPIKYGKFQMLLHDQKMIYKGNWAKEVLVEKRK